MAGKNPSFTTNLALGEAPPRPGQQVSARKPRVIVTGGSGKLGRSVVRELAAHGWNVINFDRVLSSDKEPGAFFELQIELTDMGQVMEAIQEIDMRYRGVDAVVHLAALPNPAQAPSSTLFHTNVMSTYNVLEASRKHGIKNVVLASSETLIGIPLHPHPPEKVPITEENERRPESAYSLGKLLGEEMAEQYARWDPELKVVSLRFSNVMLPEDYAKFESWQTDAYVRSWNLWGYIDARDGAQAVRLSLELQRTGHHAYIIANSNTCMRMPNSELMAKVFPNVPYTETEEENSSLLSISKAKAELGYAPRYDFQI